MLLVNGEYPMCHWEIMEYLKAVERLNTPKYKLINKKLDTSNKDRVIEASNRMKALDERQGY